MYGGSRDTKKSSLCHFDTVRACCGRSDRMKKAQRGRLCVRSPKIAFFNFCPFFCFLGLFLVFGHFIEKHSGKPVRGSYGRPEGKKSRSKQRQKVPKWDHGLFVACHRVTPYNPVRLRPNPLRGQRKTVNPTGFFRQNRNKTEKGGKENAPLYCGLSLTKFDKLYKML